MNETVISIVINKSLRRLDLLGGDVALMTYPIALGHSPKGDKQVEGDGRTPEGTFYIFAKNPKSKFHLSLGISYPDTAAARRGFAAGIITRDEHDAILGAIAEKTMPPQKTRLGGEIYIHGGGCGSDWTEGCIALANPDIETLFEHAEVGAAVTIFP